MSKVTKLNEVRTPDLYYAAYLQTAGVKLLRADREPSGRVFFVFDGSIANIDELKTAWYNNTGKVQAQPYAFNIRSLKSICHAG